MTKDNLEPWREGYVTWSLSCDAWDDLILTFKWQNSHSRLCVCAHVVSSLGFVSPVGAWNGFRQCSGCVRWVKCLCVLFILIVAGQPPRIYSSSIPLSFNSLKVFLHHLRTFFAASQTPHWPQQATANLKFSLFTLERNVCVLLPSV